jgi:hypothetical protein
MDAVGNEELVSTIEVVIDKFAAECRPYAVELCVRLVSLNLLNEIKIK